MGSVSLSLSFTSFYAGDGHSLLPGAGDFAWVHRLLDFADIWALGCIFVEMVTGDVLFVGSTKILPENLDPSLRKKKRDFYLREREREREIGDLVRSGTETCYVKVENYWIKFCPGVEDTQKKMLNLLLCKF